MLGCLEWSLPFVLWTQRWLVRLQLVGGFGRTMKDHIDTASLVVIAITFLCFGIALFVKGFTQGLLLEIGVLLVSVKLIVMAYKNSVASQAITRELGAIRELLDRERPPERPE